MSKRRLVLTSLAGAVAIAIGCSALIPADHAGFEWQPPSLAARAQELAPREDCAEHSETRSAFFGDLHVHTAHSFDARSRGLLTGPDDAYRFARGEEIPLGPFDPNGNGARTAQLERPLDFAAVTDHAEWLGEIALCTREGSPAYTSSACRVFRGEETSLLSWGLSLVDANLSKGLAVISLDGRKEDICGEGDAALCRDWAGKVWREIQASAEQYYDRTSACSFTTFHAWEYSASPGRSKLHRNVILRNEIGPELPISWVDEPTAIGLWEKLDERCNSTETGCEAMSIPHNPNLSNGRMFVPPYMNEPIEEQRRQATIRASFEHVVEMTQVKGDSECRNGLDGILGGEDELCDFEKIRTPVYEEVGQCADGVHESGAMQGTGCQSSLDFVRYALVEGLRERERLGVNPYSFGFGGSTDSHNSTPGDVEEYSYDGCCLQDATSEDRLVTGGPGAMKWPNRNPGGLIGVWASENSRDVLFDAMKARETFATTGPRIEPRFFGGWNVDGDICASNDFLTRAYATAVPMGSDLPAPTGDASAPTFALSALRDAGIAAHPGGLLQRIQIVKGWVGDEGATHQAVYDVAGDAANRASVDLTTCEPQGTGFDQLCGTWSDPDFDPNRSAVYYARAVENPSCRWSTWECIRIPEGQRPEACGDDGLTKTIQERAITSPIWYHPAG
jgi:hypothetical protein